MFWGIEKYGGKPSCLINKGIIQETNNFFVIDQKGFSLKDYLSNLTRLFKNNISFNLNWNWFLFVSYIIWCCSLLEVVYLLVYKVLILYLCTLIIDLVIRILRTFGVSFSKCSRHNDWVLQDFRMIKGLPIFIFFK